MTTSFLIGVTGGIATGKSTVMAILGELGADCIDADRVYGDLIQPGLPLWERLRSRFGNDIVADSGQIDRRALGRIVFADPRKLALLDALTHPAVVAEVVRRTEASDADVVAIEAVKLIESGLSARCDQVWLVVADRDAQITRLIARNELSLAEAEQRLASQPPDAGRREAADVIIDNSGTGHALRESVRSHWDALAVGQAAPEPSSILPK